MSGVVDGGRLRGPGKSEAPDVGWPFPFRGTVCGVFRARPDGGEGKQEQKTRSECATTVHVTH